MNNMVHSRHIQPASSDVRGEEDGAWSGFETVEVFEALALLELGVEGIGVEVEEGAEGEETSDSVDGGEEDEGAAWVAEEEVV